MKLHKVYTKDKCGLCLDYYIPVLLADVFHFATHWYLDFFFSTPSLSPSFHFYSIL